MNRENASSFFVFHFASVHLVPNFSSGSDYHCDSRHGGYRAPRTICDRGGDGCRGIHKYERRYISELRSSIPKSDVWRLDTTRLRASSCINLGWPGLLENITAIPSSERFEYVAVSDHQSGSQHYVPHIVQVLGDNLHETASAKPARQLSLVRRVFFVDQRALPLTESRRAPSIGRTRRYSASSSRSQPSRG
jgi:hypothetical protein